MRPISSRAVGSSMSGASIVSASVSGEPSSPQPIASSICFVECGSGMPRPKKNSR